MPSGQRFFIKRNDLLPPITVACTYRDGTPVDLSAATSPKFFMRSAASGAATKVDATAEVTDGAGGIIRYSWSGTDTDTVGRYVAELEVQVGGKKITFPSNEILEVNVTEDLG